MSPLTVMVLTSPPPTPSRTAAPPAPGAIAASVARVLVRLDDPEGAALAREVLTEAEGHDLYGVAREARRLLQPVGPGRS